MKIVVKSGQSELPYSLHAAHIKEIRASEDALRFVTQYGYACDFAPYSQVQE